MVSSIIITLLSLIIVVLTLLSTLFFLLREIRDKFIHIETFLEFRTQNYVESISADLLNMRDNFIHRFNKLDFVLLNKIIDSAAVLPPFGKEVQAGIKINGENHVKMGKIGYKNNAVWFLCDNNESFPINDIICWSYLNQVENEK